MPELPEVETVMRGLRARLEGRLITQVEVRRPDLRWPIPPSLPGALEGRRILGFRRRGKYILMRVEGGRSVLIHLGMSGRMVIQPCAGTGVARPHEHVLFRTDDRWEVGLTDPRRFGAVDLMETAGEDDHRLLRDVGPEPLEDGFTGVVLRSALAGKRTPLKAALLDQSVVAGLGNIYVCEALFRASLSPRRLAGTVGAGRSARLVAAIRATLTEAIEAGGSSLRDYVQTDGELGYFQHRWKVYGRADLPCERCPGPPACPGIRRTVQSGRSTFSCPLTQR